MVSIPLRGGSMSLGIIGVPRFINPVLASSDADLNLVSLIYSGLLRKDIDGNLVPDLALKYEVSENGLVYTFTLKDNLYFQDGKPLTTDDVIFTIEKVKESIIESPHKVHWKGVNAEKIDEKIVQFTFKQPYASFLENATLGILPAHVWGNSPLELSNANTSPIGSGPYMVNAANKQASGIIDHYQLIPFKKFVLGKPYIENLDLHFYPNEDELIQALLNKEVDQINSISPGNAEILKEKNFLVESAVLGRVFGLFFNQNQNQLFVDKTVLQAIESVIDKEKILQEVLLGYGMVIESPIPPNLTDYQILKAKVNKIPREELLQRVKNDLAKDGWKMGADGFLEKATINNKKKTTTKLEFVISTGNAAELVRAAELIKQDLASVGIKVDVKTFETGNLNQAVIRPRKYDTLLFGEIINNESDLFAFWHSSQRKDPGLNVALYTNAKVDKILENAAVIVDKDSRIQKYIQFTEEIKKDMPAIFLYSPDFIYTVSKNLKQLKMNRVILPSDRYLNAYAWYTETENIWKIFY